VAGVLNLIPDSDRDSDRDHDPDPDRKPPTTDPAGGARRALVLAAAGNPRPHRARNCPTARRQKAGTVLRSLLRLWRVFAVAGLKPPWRAAATSVCEARLRRRPPRTPGGPHTPNPTPADSAPTLTVCHHLVTKAGQANDPRFVVG
jgi:hypothetical protein